jgi:hypothetical protein
MTNDNGGKILAIHETGKPVRWVDEERIEELTAIAERWVDKERIEELTAIVEKLTDRLVNHGENSCFDCGALAEWKDCDKPGHEVGCYRLVCWDGCDMEDYDCTTDE